MQVFPGRKKGTSIYVYDDYVYYWDKRYENVFRCNTRRITKCRGWAILQDNTVNVVTEHNHPRSPFMKEQIEMKQEMLERSSKTHTGLKDIFDSVCRSNPDAAEYLSFTSMRCNMRRERTKSQPRIPDTLASLYDILKNSDIIENIYKENITTSNGKTAIILSTNYLLDALASTTEIYVDGTFSVLPRKPHIAQLYTVHIRYMDTGIATLFVMSDVRTTTLYDALWDKIIELVPQLKQNIKFIMSDFEMAAVKSLNKNFTTAKLTGCWFHFNQAVLRKWRKLHLSSATKTVLSMTMTLPLLPPEKFQEALSIIQTEADLLSNEYPHILQFMSYLRLTWSNMASKISTYRCPVRTNNIVESFHNIAVQKIGTRNTNVWTFLDKLSHLITDQELDLRRLKNGIRPRRPRTRANRELDSKIINAQEDLVSGRLSLKEFLLMFTRNNMFQMEQMTLLEDININDEHVVDVELFSDNTEETFHTWGQNIRRRRRHRNVPNRREINNIHETSADSNRESSSRIETITHEQLETNIANTSSQEEETDAVGEEETIVLETSLDNDGNSSSVQTTHEQSEINVITEDNFNGTENDEWIYEVPEDDYSSLLDNSASTEEDLPYHTVNWNLEDNQNTSEEVSSTDTCTVCLANERTHAFIPCGHHACCHQCIERLESSRCPICNTRYSSCIRIINA
ncbi:uncharacterized protein LOC143894176 isoform X1 [Temnothorax americanus]|uniref:uncharacterized protein LOC143894176 isoform X1 n=1 Tax=Temnothorax americanus TaxID=1964332 RepID=UPI004067D406